MATDLLPKLVTKIPGPHSRKLAVELRRYESRNVVHISDQFPIFWERASGANVWDVDGNRYVDMVAGFGVANAGHSNRHVVAAQRAQGARLLHGMADVHPTEARLRLARELSRLTFQRWGMGRGKVLFGSGGAEAVELALKTAAMATRKPGVIAFEGAYHGLTYGALDTTWSAHYRRPFSQQLGHFTIHLPFPKEGSGGQTADDKRTESAHEVLERMAKALRHAPIGAVLLEPIQARAGIIVPPPEFLSLVRQFCDLHGLVMIADEIYTGFGRTGKWFAVEHFRNAPSQQQARAPRHVVPDIICVAKGMTGGFPISACIGRADIMDAWPESEGDPIHTSTCFGNPVGCAMALAQIEQIKAMKLVARSWQLGNEFQHALRLQLSALDCVGEIRGRGLFIGVELVEKPAARPASASRVFKVVASALQRGIILLADGLQGNVLSLTPPLTISKRQLDCAASAIGECLKLSLGDSQG
jgi:4-aminobutyrate aminotransferase-like enzyme